MAPNTLSDQFVAFAFWAGLAALLLTLVLAAEILRLRFALRLHQRREAAAFAKWRPPLHDAIVGITPLSLPELKPAERLHFLTLWVHLQASVRGDATEELNDIARRVGIVPRVRTFLQRGPRAHRLLAALTLGHLRDRDAWPQLLQLAGQPDKALALTALWAMVRVDAKAAAEYMTPLFVEREDWALARVAGILQQARADASEVLARMLPTLDEARLPRALRIAEALRMQLPAATLDAALSSESPALLIAALRGIETPLAIEAVRRLLAHDNWQVRVQAARALGRVGEAADVDRLAALLSDREWWVRYRAAQAMAELAALSGRDLTELRAALTDRFGADMLAQVMAEQEAA
ncbi:MAG TPA: HEAT repeat domain-containing protein [Telluria sp.]|nr:HEAT repeat domain-containing protein [Telluria sp.]